jgi:hypothetical protein
MGVERVRPNDEDIHLHAARQVYGVERRAAGDRVVDGVRAHVPLTTERLHEAGRLAPGKVGHDVQVVGGAGLSVERAGERSRCDVGDAEPIEDGGYCERDAERVG